MLNRSSMRSPWREPVRLWPGCRSGMASESRYRIVAGLIALILLVQPACLFHKKKSDLPAAAPAAPSRIVLLPFNIPADNTELRWVALAAPILLAKTMEASPDLEVVPIWQGMPIAVEALGQSRELTPESAAYVASRLTAKWSTDGQLSPSKDGMFLTLDFIPAKPTLIAYRYQKDVRVDSLGMQFHDATTQFLSYLVARPLGKPNSSLADAKSLRQLAEALDLEYGWFVPSNPGKAGSVVSNLIQTDLKLAKLLFNPGIYPGLGAPAPKPRPIELRPIPPPPAEKSSPEPTAPPNVQAPPSGPPPEAETAELTVTVPPPRTFSQKMRSSPPVRTVKTSTRAGVEPPAPAPSPPPGRAGAAQSLVEPKRQEKSPPVSANARVGPPKTPKVDYLPSATVETPPSTKSMARSEDAVAPPASSTSRPVKGFMVQVYASHSKENIGAKAREIEREGFVAEVEQVDLKEKGVWYRIRIAGYDTRQAAIKAARKLLSTGIIQEYWIVPQN